MVLGWVDTQWQFPGPLYQRNEKKLLTDPVTSLFFLNFSTRSRATGGQLATLERNFDAMANWWFLCHEFKTANSFSWSGNFVFRNFYEFIHINFVLSRKLQIHSYEFVRVFSIFCCEWPVLYVSLYSDEWKNRSPGIYYLKSLETLVN